MNIFVFAILSFLSSAHAFTHGNQAYRFNCWNGTPVGYLDLIADAKDHTLKIGEHDPFTGEIIWGPALSFVQPMPPFEYYVYEHKPPVRLVVSQFSLDPRYSGIFHITEGFFQGGETLLNYLPYGKLIDSAGYLFIQYPTQPNRDHFYMCENSYPLL